MNRRRFAAALAAGAATALAGCASSGGGPDDTTTTTDGTTTETTATTTTTASTGATVAVRSVGEHGDVLVGPDGMSLYLFTRDEGSTSVCYDDCAESWPPLTVDGDPAAGTGVSATLGTTERDDGTTQVTAAGKPLYYYAGDSAPGDANGQGVGDVWFLLSPDGTAVGGTSTTTTDDETTTDDGGLY